MEKAAQKTRLWLAEVAQEVEMEVGGKVVSEEEVALKRGRSLSNLNQNSTMATTTTAMVTVTGGEEGAGAAKAKI